MGVERRKMRGVRARFPFLTICPGSCVSGSSGAPHEAWVQDSELWQLAVRGAGRDREPLVCVRQEYRPRQVELGRAIEAGYGKAITVLGRDGEFSRVEPIEFPACTVHDLNRWFSSQLTNVDDEGRARFRARSGKSTVGKPAPDDIACLRQRKVPRVLRHR